MMSATWARCLLTSLVFSQLACGGGSQEATTVTAAHWKALQEKRVLFAHQSVGHNILNGMKTLAARSAFDLRVTESRDLAASGNIIHFAVGQNGDALSKMKDFATTLRASPEADVDVAMMKLCYLDFQDDVDAVKIADQYIATLDGLTAEFPRIRFVAFTAPITVAQKGPKAWAKRLLGRTPAGYAENVRRQQFNERLRARYRPEGRLFDLAQIEVQGAAVQYYLGSPFEALDPAMTSDGGHLNAEGEQRVAAQLVEFLGGLPPLP